MDGWNVRENWWLFMCVCVCVFFICQYVDVHLLFMAFLLQDGGLYMPNKRAGEVWDTLIPNPNSCEDDRAVSGRVCAS